MTVSVKLMKQISTLLFVIVVLSLLPVYSASAKDRANIEALTEKALYGDAKAQNKLGLMYERGEGGLNKNYDEAVKWYRLAAEQGNVLALRNLGRMYANGHGVVRNEEKARRLFREADKLEKK